MLSLQTSRNFVLDRGGGRGNSLNQKYVGGKGGGYM